MSWLRSRPDEVRGSKAIARAILLAVVAAAAVGVQPAYAQIDDLAAQCPAGPPDVRLLCLLAVQAVEVGQPRVGIALAGGNPVPGTASTLGLRLGRVPRVSVTGRATLAAIEIPPIREHGADRRIRLAAPALGINGAVGILPGHTLLPGVGGVGSLDLLGSVAFVPIPERRGFEGHTPFSWGLGARLGLLRESFVMPGVSVSGMYRRLGNLEYGDEQLVDTDAFFRARMSNVSLRAAASKRVLLVGATAGLGYDRYRSDVALGVREPAAVGGGEHRFEYDGFSNSRWNAFANVSWTMLVVHLVAEGGWQSGGDRVPGLTDEQIRIDPGSGALYGGVAIRIAI